MGFATLRIRWPGMIVQIRVSRLGVGLDYSNVGVVKPIRFRKLSSELSWLASPRFEVVQFIDAAF